MKWMVTVAMLLPMSCLLTFLLLRVSILCIYVTFELANYYYVNLKKLSFSQVLVLDSQCKGSCAPSVSSSVLNQSIKVFLEWPKWHCHCRCKCQ